jgi:PadR family transcriptional regulator PadR
MTEDESDRANSERTSDRATQSPPMWGLVQPAILLVLSEDARHGYALIDELRDRDYLPGTADVGNLYRGLRKMERLGYVVSEWARQPGPGPKRRMYSITHAGRQALFHEALALADRASYVERILSEYRRLNPDGPPTNDETN